jgi:hypothetical protein
VGVGEALDLGWLGTIYRQKNYACLCLEWDIIICLDGKFSIYVISYGLSLGGYRVYIQFSIVHCGPLGPLSILFCKYLQKH